MLVHTVFFWLKEGLGEQELSAFRQGLETLRGVETVRALYFGRAVKSARPVVDSSYSFGLTVVFDDQAGHDTYQEHPVHLAFVDKCAKYWTRVQVYDFQ